MLARTDRLGVTALTWLQLQEVAMTSTERLQKPTSGEQAELVREHLRALILRLRDRRREREHLVH